MLRRKSPTSLDLNKQTLRNAIFYFIFLVILLVHICGVNAQGNRGVIINNQKFNDSSGTHNEPSTKHENQMNLLNYTQLFTSSTSKVIIASENKIEKEIAC